MKLFSGLSLTLLMLATCGGGGSSTGGAHEPILNVNGTATVAGKPVTLAYGVSRVLPSSGTVQIIVSDVEMSCLSFAMTHAPNHGTFVTVEVPNADKGVASKHFVSFQIFANGDYAKEGGGSNRGAVEVLDSTDTTIAVRVAYRDTIQNCELALNGEFSTVRCP